MANEDRERNFEQALARHLRGEVGAVACPDEETLAAFHERTLSSAEMKATTEHVAACSRCQEIFDQLVATDEIPLPEGAQNDFKLRDSALSTGALYIDYAARQTPIPAIAGQPKPPLKTPKNISSGRGFETSRWVAPAGAIAAVLLIWLVARDNKTQPLSRSENVQIAQEQPTENRLVPRPLPAARPPTSRESKVPSESQKDNARTRQPSAESGAVHAPERYSPNLKARSADRDIASSDSQTNAPAAPSASSSLAPQAVPSPSANQESRSSSPSTAAVSAPTSAPSRELRAQSVPATGATAKTDAKQSANAIHTFEPRSNGNEGIEGLATEQVTATGQLAPPSLKKDNFDKSKIILAPKGAMRWRLLPAGQIEQSVDSGATWVPQSSGVKVELLAGSAPSQAVCWLVGRAGTILRTTDGGGHWNKLVSPISGDIVGVEAVDAMTATIFDSTRSAPSVTHNGGVTWESTKN